MKTQTKIILSLTTIFLAYILIFSGFIYYSISSYAYTDFYKRLEIRAVTAAKIELESDQDINVVKEIRQNFLEKLPEEKIYIIDIATYDEEEKIQIPNHFVNQIIQQNRASYNEDDIFYSGIKYEAEGKEYIVIVSAENYYSSHHIVHLRNMLLIALGVSFLLVFTLSYLFSRKVVLPIKEMVKNMKTISSENMNFRLEVPKNNTELEALTLSFNDMLNRLETSFETQKNFISNASHELNTPLTSIIGETEVTLAKPRSTEEYIGALQTVLEEAEKLNKKTKALLFLAQTGYDGKVQKFERMRIDQVILDVKKTVEKIYPEAKLHLDFSLLPETSDRLKIKGNAQLLHLAFSNIVMNACKYSDNRLVDIALGVSNDNAIIVVKDQGIGIPENELQYIYDPFFRASNTRNYEGYGIGLPLSRNVIKMHKGELTVNSFDNQGTTVEIKLPTYYKKF